MTASRAARTAFGYALTGLVVLVVIATGVMVLVAGLTRSVPAGGGASSAEWDLRSWVLGSSFLLLGALFVYAVVRDRPMLQAGTVVLYALISFVFRLSVGGPHFVFGVPLVVIGLLLLRKSAPRTGPHAAA